jgi:hypothetical protein
MYGCRTRLRHLRADGGQRDRPFPRRVASSTRTSRGKPRAKEPSSLGRLRRNRKSSRSFARGGKLVGGATSHRLDHFAKPGTSAVALKSGTMQRNYQATPRAGLAMWPSASRRLAYPEEYQAEFLILCRLYAAVNAGRQPWSARLPDGRGHLRRNVIMAVCALRVITRRSPARQASNLNRTSSRRDRGLDELEKAALSHAAPEWRSPHGTAPRPQHIAVASTNTIKPTEKRPPRV